MRIDVQRHITQILRKQEVIYNDLISKAVSTKIKEQMMSTTGKDLSDFKMSGPR